MELVSQDIKREMERCKRIARAAGLTFDDNTLEYIVTNRDMIELSPRGMIPTLYDYWVHDVETLQGNKIYDAFPHNPYETVINTRPAMSFYNQDNADWFNVMIFYHVLGHIDFFQNNVFFRNTWDDDFAGSALADKRLINRIREELGSEKRWVDYIIEFSRSIDNLVGFFPELEITDSKDKPQLFGVFSSKVNFYFGQFLRERNQEGVTELNFYHDELDRLNRCIKQFGDEEGEEAFFTDNTLRGRFPEFNDALRKWQEKEQKPKPIDIFEYLFMNSEVLKREKNSWMKDVMQVVRRTSLYFQPQMRSKICNEGWASFWHQRLFIPDERIQTHEVDFAVVDSGVTSTPRMGSNPYAIGKSLFEFIEDLARKGKLSPEYKLLQGVEERRHYDTHRGDDYARDTLLEVRKYVNDDMLINFLSEDDFQDFVDRYRLFIVGVRPHEDWAKWDKAEVYIKSRNGNDYRELLNQSIYHPPHFTINEDKAEDGELYLDHTYEGRSLHSPHIRSVLIGLEFLWGKPVHIETTEYEDVMPTSWWEWNEWGYKPKHRISRILYTCEDKQVKRQVL